MRPRGRPVLRSRSAHRRETSRRQRGGAWCAERDGRGRTHERRCRERSPRRYRQRERAGSQMRHQDAGYEEHRPKPPANPPDVELLRREIRRLRDLLPRPTPKPMPVQRPKPVPQRKHEQEPQRCDAQIAQPEIAKSSELPPKPTQAPHVALQTAMQQAMQEVEWPPTPPLITKPAEANTPRMVATPMAGAQAPMTCAQGPLRTSPMTAPFSWAGESSGSSGTSGLDLMTGLGILTQPNANAELLQPLLMALIQQGARNQ